MEHKLLSLSADIRTTPGVRWLPIKRDIVYIINSMDIVLFYLQFVLHVVSGMYSDSTVMGFLDFDLLFVFEKR